MMNYQARVGARSLAERFVFCEGSRTQLNVFTGIRRSPESVVTGIGGSGWGGRELRVNDGGCDCGKENNCRDRNHTTTL
jgi:hypothetical protein